MDMTETDANGHSSKTGMDQGFTSFVETYVPENVKGHNLSVPRFSADDHHRRDNWNYDVTVYPKNETGMPTLEKTLREDKVDTGKHNGTIDDITDGYAHTGTGSDGDIVDYQIISTLPTNHPMRPLWQPTPSSIHSKGIEYNKKDVQIEWFTDKGLCTDKIATWTEADNKFTVTYGTAANNATTMKNRDDRYRSQWDQQQRRCVWPCNKPVQRLLRLHHAHHLRQQLILLLIPFTATTATRTTLYWHGSAQTPPPMIHSRTTAISTCTVWISSSSSLTARVTSKMSSSSSTTIPISTG